MKVYILLCSCLLVLGCAVYGIRSETGNPIVEENVKKIVKGKTTATEILGLFGAPTQNSVLGENEIYVYKNCKTSGGAVSVPYVGKYESKERCNTLTISIDKKTGIVQSYNYQKMFEGD